MELTPALGTNIKDCPDNVLDGKTWRITSKVDGVRRLFYKSHTGQVSAYSRTNKKDKWLTHIFTFLEAPWFPFDTVYDCELVDRELYFAKVPSFVLRAETTGKASQQYPDNKGDLMAICFDIFKPGGDLRTGKERHDELSRLFSGFSQSEPMIMVPYYGTINGAEMDVIDDIMTKEMKRNGEGIMLMDMGAMYIPGRSKTSIKVKRLQEFEGRIIDVEMARVGTKIEGGVAALICDVPGCTVPVRVGSGLNNTQRYEMAADAHLIGKKIEIEAFSYSQNKKGFISLNLPIFKQFAA